MTPLIFAIFIIVAELVFPLWLLIKGINLKVWQERYAGLAYT